MEVDVSSSSDLATNVLFSLRADRSLLDPTFDRYILRTEKLAMFKRRMDDKIRFKLPSDSQWGYQQIRAHTLASHLFFDHFASSVDQQLFFTFLDDLRLISFIFDRTSNRWSVPVQVADIGTSSVALSPSFVFVPEDDAFSQSFPESLHFVDSRTAISARGLNTFSVWDTGERRPTADGTTQKWREVFHYELPPLRQLNDDGQKGGVGAADGGTRAGTVSVYPSLILDARRAPTEGGTDAERGGNSAIDILLLTVEPTAEKKDEGQTDAKGAAKAGGGAAKRQGITPEGKSVFRTNLIWVTVQAEQSKLDEEDGDSPQFVVPRIRQILCDGKVEFACFDASVPRRLVVFGVGRQPQFVWDSAKPSPPLPTLSPSETMEVVLPQQPADVAEEHKAIGGAAEIAVNDVQPSAAGDAQQQFNSEQLEECDRPPDAEDDVSAFWLDGDSHELVAMTIVNELLFTQKISPGGAPVFATRYDVDTIVWQLDPNVSPSDQKQNNVLVNHLFTLNAFGYIQAGHQDKRFLGCSPDGRYAALINRTNHCFLYFQNSAISSEHELKNRRTGKRAEHIAKQLVLSMSDLDKEFDPNNSSNEFIAFHATADTLFLLTRCAIYAVEMPK
ncbi:hypothetical protein niasHS_015187 [Heterodera schachtii]|uniref:NudC domain-containing protein 1 n=1 Tax=Heterodera schachtii TaxID=97005 RepID=A0ABD2I8R4_HETSC